MADCCTQGVSKYLTSTSPNRYRCPVNGREYASVSTNTIKFHIRSVWNRPLKQQAYYFCKDADCDVVYFGEDDSVIEQSSLRSAVGIKQRSPQAMLCYCFGITRADAVTSSAPKTFVVKQTTVQACACETRNPSGRCCLADFPKS